ncbi:FAD-binding oxidoreductase [Spongisporangium articulatum]|uniref:FAD-binding oxidoreductase n=1 Tax=Spongisporangium articulatum TaxID=3362603 RepID=A0ABW8ALI4_9ACTN
MASELQRELSAAVDCPVLVAGDDGYDAETAGFNTSLTHTPDLVVAARSAADVAAAVRFAGGHDLALHVMATGHRDVPVTEGLLVSTRRLTGVEIDAQARTATVGPGVRWAQLVEAAAAEGLFAVPGSSPTVGVTGYLLGGGLGPLARSHGFSSDYLVGAQVVTGTGEVLDVDAQRHDELFWALRGGKAGLGIVTQVRLRLVELREVYGGSLLFGADAVEPALRAWLDWTASCDPEATSSAVVVRFPDLEQLPPPLRDRVFLSIRFVHPDLDRGAELAAPLREAAEVFADELGVLPVAQIAKVHSDPPAPGPGWVRGLLLERADGEVASVLLDHRPGGDSPLRGIELRHVGSPASRRDVPEGSAVGGRGADYVVTVVGIDPAEVGDALPAEAQQIVDELRAWTSPVQNVNFNGQPLPPEQYAANWPLETFMRLSEVRHRYDPEGVLS